MNQEEGCAEAHPGRLLYQEGLEDMGGQEGVGGVAQLEQVGK